ncbi:nucleotidyltransferase domain-containing protein [Rhizobacter sp. OV335]|uniref:nucleotidyltransferase domain-containing protein n=1 Tax=Rhizobacter sp. OV335 TaxID=1500264 RepID=UPI0009201B14|nr:nucleotidyltransferase domain-containing protein [Rhizobacter sp. OV335]SHN34769.1 Nucleotidyltransferase domain-containing protein [Rhizobacter sp. OV335]
MSDILTALFGGKTKARILEVLLSNPDQTYHLRGLAQAAGTDSGNTSKLLRVLVDGGVVRALPDSPSMRYAINLDSPLAEPLRSLFARAGSLMEDLRTRAQTLAATYIAVFGSQAAGTADALSDVDVLVVGELSAVSAQAAFKPVGRQHHKSINVVVVSPPELALQLSAGSAFWSSVAAGARVDLKGTWSDVAKREAVADTGLGLRSLPAGQGGDPSVD